MVRIHLSADYAIGMRLKSQPSTPLKSFMIYDSGDVDGNYFVVLHSNQKDGNMGWTAQWREHIEGVIQDMNLTDYEANVARKYCGWHLINPDPYSPRAISIKKTVHTKDQVKSKSSK